jgi:hypothetical protein
MPNFDGTGPLKRGQVIGRGLGPCRNCGEGCSRKADDKKSPVRNEATEE